MKRAKNEFEDRLMKGVRNGSITLLQAHEERILFKKLNEQSNFQLLEEGEKLETIPSEENHQIKTSYKWATEQVEEIKSFGNFYQAYFDDNSK